jgi:hypothetical protein
MTLVIRALKIFLILPWCAKLFSWHCLEIFKTYHGSFKSAWFYFPVSLDDFFELDPDILEWTQLDRCNLLPW